MDDGRRIIMDFLTALHVSGSGLSAERTRVNLASSNLANAETTRGPNGKPYQRLDPVFQSIHIGAQDEAATVGQSPLGVQVSQIVSASRAFEANATAVETLKTMAARGLDITK
jgi:flagellar basal-body rod protein FlgC